MEEKTGSQQIDDIIEQYGGWKGKTIAHIRAIIKAVEPDVVEEVKWKMRSRPEGLPVWSHNGILCILETFKNDQKLVFFKGAQMEGLQKFFNARLNSKTDRAIEFHEDSVIDETVITELILEAVRLNDLKEKQR